MYSHSQHWKTLLRTYVSNTSNPDTGTFGWFTSFEGGKQVFYLAVSYYSDTAGNEKQFMYGSSAPTRFYFDAVDTGQSLYLTFLGGALQDGFCIYPPTQPNAYQATACWLGGNPQILTPQTALTESTISSFFTSSKKYSITIQDASTTIVVPNPLCSQMPKVSTPFTRTWVGKITNGTVDAGKFGYNDTSGVFVIIISHLKASEISGTVPAEQPLFYGDDANARLYVTNTGVRMKFTDNLSLGNCQRSVTVVTPYTDMWVGAGPVVIAGATQITGANVATYFTTGSSYTLAMEDVTSAIPTGTGTGTGTSSTSSTGTATGTSTSKVLTSLVTSSTGKSNKTLIIIIAVIAGVVLLVIIAVIVFLLMRKKTPSIPMRFPLTQRQQVMQQRAISSNFISPAALQNPGVNRRIPMSLSEAVAG